MVKEFFIHALFLVTILSGLITILAAAGWFWGAEDAKVAFLVSGLVLVPCLIGVSFVKDGWKRLLVDALPF